MSDQPRPPRATWKTKLGWWFALVVVGSFFMRGHIERNPTSPAGVVIFATATLLVWLWPVRR